MYSLLVIDAGLSPAYVLDAMRFYEISAILDGLQYKNRENWEQTRMICYVMAQTNCTKKLSPSDIIKFPWDEAEVHDTTISEKDRERLKKKAEQYINNR